MRVFVALVLPDLFRRKLIESTAPLCAARSELRWVQAAQLHLTLAFLGELDDRGADIAEEAARDAAAASFPFTLGATGLLALPRRSAARVLTATADEGSREAAFLAERLESALADIGREAGHAFRPREKRPFTAHITLARSGRGGAAFTDEELKLPVQASARIDFLAVYESILGSGQARYRELRRFALGGER